MSEGIFSNDTMNDIIAGVNPGFAKMQLVSLFAIIQPHVNDQGDENLINDLKAFFRHK